MNRIVLDVEATGTFTTAKVYDLGGVVLDAQGNILEQFNFVIEEIFYNDRLMQSAYYAEKLPQYYEEIKAGIREVVPFRAARAALFTLAKQYKVKEFWAYNAKYDQDALNYTAKYLLGYSFFMRGMNIRFRCIMGAFMSTLGHTAKYCKCAEITDAGRVLVNAENAYRYIANVPEFVEEHTGLCDALIEAEVLTACLRQRKKMDTEPKSLQSFPAYNEIQAIYKAL